MARVDQIYQGSWNGVEFYFLDAKWNPGQRGQLHEYPDRDSGYFEPLGQRTEQFTLDVFLVSDDWVSERQALAQALRKGEGTLLHPEDGRMSAICIDVLITDTVNEMGRVGLTLTFLPGNTPLDPGQKDTGSDIDSAGDDAAAAADDGLSDDLDVDGQTPDVRTSTTSFLGGALDAIGQAAGFVHSVLTAAAVLEGEAFSIVGGAIGWFSYAVAAGGAIVRTVVNDVMAFTGLNPTIEQVNVSWGADLASTRASVTLIVGYDGLGAQLISLVRGISTLRQTGSGDPFQGWSWQRRVGPLRSVFKASSATDASAGKALTTIGGYSGETIAAVFQQQLQLVAAMVRPAPPVSAAAQTVANLNAIADVVRQAALIEAAGAFSAMPFDSRTDAFVMRDRLAQAIDDEVNLVANGTVRKAFRALRLAVIADARMRSAGLPDVKTITLPIELPAIVLAAQLYDDPGMAADLAARNGVDNPLFMPAGVPIEVLTNG